LTSAGSQNITAEDRAVARAAFRKVFRSFDPYGSPFQPSVPARLLISQSHPWVTNPWGLNTTALRALLAAADDHDLERVFVSVVDPQDSQWDDNLYVLAPLSLDTYLHSPVTDAWSIVPHALSPGSGAWGVISSDESHVLVGGSEQFIADLSAGLAQTQDEMIVSWLEDWSEHQDQDPDGGLRIGDWIPAQLAHVVGPERAEAALRASRLRRWDLPPH
jgi:hypothetical protein